MDSASNSLVRPRWNLAPKGWPFTKRDQHFYGSKEHFKWLQYIIDKLYIIHWSLDDLDDWRLNITNDNFHVRIWPGHKKSARPFALQSWNTWHSACLWQPERTPSHWPFHGQHGTILPGVLHFVGLQPSRNSKGVCRFFGPFAWSTVMRGENPNVIFRMFPYWGHRPLHHLTPDSQYSHRLQVIGRCSAPQRQGKLRVFCFRFSSTVNQSIGSFMWFMWCLLMLKEQNDPKLQMILVFFVHLCVVGAWKGLQMLLNPFWQSSNRLLLHLHLTKRETRWHGCVADNSSQRPHCQKSPLLIC